MTTAIEAVMKYARQRPGLEFGNYGDRKLYDEEMRGITKQLARARKAEELCVSLGVTDEDVLEASKYAFSGRLSLQKTENGWSIDYCTGQYWPTEYRAAVATVLESAVTIVRRRNADASPPAGIVAAPGSKIRMSELQRLHEEVGGHWFDKDTMRSFGTKILTPFALVGSNGLAHFVTSDDNFDRSEKFYNVRTISPKTGDTGQVGEYNEFTSLAAAQDAMAAALKLPVAA